MGATTQAIRPDAERISIAARAIEVRGVVQGVGFRPFVWRLATDLNVRGWVRNRGGFVELHAEADPDTLDRFCRSLEDQAPPLAQVDVIRWTSSAAIGLTGFTVDDSPVDRSDTGTRLVPPDVATCPACLAEILDPNDRRYRYAFTNCTECGPRFTIIEELPYDRARTSMRAFPLCEDCAREYHDPSNRRFHAEPVACPACGPSLELRDAGWERVPGDPIADAAQLLRDGWIVAVKGLGGFHLACDATNDDAVADLRVCKQRPAKPFAVMVADLDAARELFDIDAHAVALLSSGEAPIVLVADRGRLSPSVAPGHRRQGVMLPSTPLHHLLLRETGVPLVMTSGNRSEEPICISNEDARERLTSIADAFLVHDREIVARYDDSVMRVWEGGAATIRRARGLAPSALKLPAPVPPILGTGALLHGAFCLASGTTAHLSQHVGDLATEEAMGAFAEALTTYQRVFDIEPRFVAHDRHPDFPSTRFAEASGLPTVAVQHHHAHVAAVMAEHRLEGAVIGVAFDGFGLGDDGTVWGGEFLVCDSAHAVRFGHLRTVRQPGGDAAVRHPWRMALSHAVDAGCEDGALRLLRARDAEVEIVLRQLRSGLTSPQTSSAGRLFDAMSALAGACTVATYEGQPAILLEQLAEGVADRAYPVSVSLEDGRLIVDTRPIVCGVVEDLRSGTRPGIVSARFHRTLAHAIADVCRRIRDATGLTRVCFGGGVFVNDVLLTQAARLVCDDGFELFVPRVAPAGDGGIALGQVLVGGARAAEG